jgi:hypothetical protein
MHINKKICSSSCIIIHFYLFFSCIYPFPNLKKIIIMGIMKSTMSRRAISNLEAVQESTRLPTWTGPRIDDNEILKRSERADDKIYKPKASTRGLTMDLDIVIHARVYNYSDDQLEDMINGDIQISSVGLACQFGKRLDLERQTVENELNLIISLVEGVDRMLAIVTLTRMRGDVNKVLKVLSK